MNSRLDILKDWLTTHIGIAKYDLAPASADASFRQYYRVIFDDQSVIVMDAPPDKENTSQYINVARFMRSSGLNVPKILHYYPEMGFLMISDLGKTMYLDALNADNADSLYHDAIDSLLKLQTNGIKNQNFLPLYDRTLLHKELQIFNEWYLIKHIAVHLNQKQLKEIDSTFELLVNNALMQPTVCVHRDYHSRNLMLSTQGNPGVLDFQDAVIGPVTYDLVSLLKDCYIAWPKSKVREWVTYYYHAAVEKKLLQSVDFDQFLRWFDLTGMQRHLKAIGIFARLNHRDGKNGYLKDIPRTYNYVTQVCLEYEELHGFKKTMDELFDVHSLDIYVD